MVHRKLLMSLLSDLGSRFSLVVLATFCIIKPCLGEVFLAQDEALEEAFPRAGSVKRHAVILTEEEREQVQKRARAKVESKLVTVFEGRSDNGSLGFAFIDSVVVRTFTTTFLVKLTPEGTVSRVMILAFHEPPEYLPSDRWLTQFKDKPLSADLSPGRKIVGIVGSTLSAHAISDGVRRALAMFEQIKPKLKEGA